MMQVVVPGVDQQFIQRRVKLAHLMIDNVGDDAHVHHRPVTRQEDVHQIAVQRRRKIRPQRFQRLADDFVQAIFQRVQPAQQQIGINRLGLAALAEQVDGGDCRFAVVLRRGLDLAQQPGGMGEGQIRLVGSQPHQRYRPHILCHFAHHRDNFVGGQPAQVQVALVRVADIRQHTQQLFADQCSGVVARALEIMPGAPPQHRPGRVVQIGLFQCVQRRVDHLAPAAGIQQFQRHIAGFCWVGGLSQLL